MWERKVLLAALVVSAMGLAPIPAAADKIVIEVAPPAPRHEVIPAERRGYVWQPGYWDWRNGHHVWVKGHWVKERKGYYWHPNRWEQRDRHWYFEKGRWDRERFARLDDRRGGMGDKDRDGVPNRFDRDRDGDGVANRFDAKPDNPRRH